MESWPSCREVSKSECTRIVELSNEKLELVISFLCCLIPLVRTLESSTKWILQAHSSLLILFQKAVRFSEFTVINSFAYLTISILVGTRLLPLIVKCAEVRKISSIADSKLRVPLLYPCSISYKTKNRPVRRPVCCNDVSSLSMVIIPLSATSCASSIIT